MSCSIDCACHQSDEGLSDEEVAAKYVPRVVVDLCLTTSLLPR